MTDLELLIFAAKAVNIEWYGYAVDDQCQCRYLDIGEEDVIKWNPLRDDGDAFRLMIHLDLSSLMSFSGDKDEKRRSFWSPNSGYDGGKSDTDYAEYTFNPIVETRRAIVKAAAEIGRNME